MILAIQEGFARASRSAGLVLVLLGVNLGLAATLAVPLSERIESDLRDRDAAVGMLYGFDYSWWSQWAAEQEGWTADFGPALLGVGFVFRNVELLLQGQLPLRLFHFDAPGQGTVSTLVLGLGTLYLLIQVFLTGGLLSVLRSPRGSWTFRGLIHGSGFYVARLLRVTLLTLATLALVYGLSSLLGPWADEQAREAVSETTAMVWLLGRHGLLLLAVLLVQMISSYAKVIVVVDQRSSALLAYLSALAFCLSRPWRCAGHYLSMTLLAVLLIAWWNVLDGRWETTGFRTQLVTLLLAQGLMAARLWLRLALLGGQVALYQAEGD